jgi:small subunit ribosomal protein S17
MAEKKTTAKKTATTEKAPAAERKTVAKSTAARKTTTAKKPTAEKKTTAVRGGRGEAPATSKAAAPATIKRARPLRRAPAAAAQAEGQPYSWRRSRRRTRIGLVSSAKQPHTVTVVVERMREHPLYKKVVRLRKKYAAHDAAGDVRAGDLVRIQESRPFSATKHWQVVEVLSRAGEAGAAAPRVEDVEKLLEQAEGVDTILAPQREEKAEPVAEASQQ